MDRSKNILEIKTQHSQIKLIEDSTEYVLRASGNAIHSIVSKQHPHRIQLKNLEYLMGILLFSNSPKKVLLLGTGGGSLLHFFLHFFPSCHLTTIDIDRELIELLQTNMGLPPNSSQLNHHFCDARDFLLDNNDQYDLILVDIFIGAQSPYWLLEKDMLDQLCHQLEPDHGALAMNLIISSPSGFKTFYQSLRRTFKRKTLCLGIEDYENTLAFAIKGPCPMNLDLIRSRANMLSDQTGIAFEEILAQLAMTNPIGTGII